MNVHFFWIRESDPQQTLPSWFENALECWREGVKEESLCLHLFDRKGVIDWVSHYFSDWVNIFKKLSVIQMVDVLRYQWSYVYGGISCDLDIIPKLPLFNYLESNSKSILLFVGKLKLEIPKNREDNPLELLNGFCISKEVNNPFWLEVLSVVKQRVIQGVDTDYDVMFSTGPIALAEGFVNWKNKKDIQLCLPFESDNYFDHLALRSWSMERL